MNNSFINFAYPYVFIGGSYEHSRNIDALCKVLGSELAKFKIGVISGGGNAGMRVCNFMDKTLNDLGEYDPFRMLTYYRKKSSGDYIHTPRYGCNVFIGKDIQELRNAMLARASVMIIISGSSRTKEEFITAEAKGIFVVPIGMSGGIAYDVWYEKNMSNAFCYPSLLPALNIKNPSIATEAVIKILKLRFLLRD